MTKRKPTRSAAILRQRREAARKAIMEYQWPTEKPPLPPLTLDMVRELIRHEVAAQMARARFMVRAK